MAEPNLPLLHKYVFKEKDNLQLRMTKLKYRLCVQEVASIIHGRHSADFSDIEPSIEPDYNMTTSVEACPPRMEDFTSVNNDEGLSSPGSDEFPQKTTNDDHIYNDSGIIFDESSTANNTQLENNIDAVDDLAETDPSHYHISRTAYDHFDDSAVVMNGDDTGVIAEEVIQPKKVIREKVHVNFDDVPHYARDASPSPPATPTDSPVVMVTDIDAPAEEPEEVKEEVILRSTVKRDEESTPTEDEETPEEEDENEVDFVPGITCNTVETALQILKTHYRLGSSTLRKSIITSPDSKNKRYSAPVFSYERSKWNLQDLIRTPNDYPSWKVQEVEKPEEKDDIEVLTDTMNRKDEELAKLLQKVLDEERKKSEEQDKKGAAPEPEIIELKEEPVQQAAPDNKQADGQQDQEPSKKKKRNIFRRMLRALRKRFSTNHQRSQ